MRNTCKILAYKLNPNSTELKVSIEGDISKELIYLKKNGLLNGEILIDDGRLITANQRKKIYALINDIALYTGDVPEYTKEIMKYFFASNTGVKMFSLGACDLSVAKDFITYLLDFCLNHDIPLSERGADRAEDLTRYFYSCIKYKKCAICGKVGEIHHWDTIGMGRDRTEVDDSDLRKICLCREHHTEAHALGVDSFEKKYKVFGILFN